MHSRKHQISNPVDDSTTAVPSAHPDPEVVPAAKRRTFRQRHYIQLNQKADISTLLEADMSTLPSLASRFLGYSTAL
jgi:hypothetical protein